MFTGIVEQQGKVLSNLNKGKSHRLVISAVFDDLQVGESIAVNGVCLTLLPSETAELSFDVSPETLALTTLGSLSSGETINLERAMCAATRFGGHYVSGHVDAMAQVLAIDYIDDYIDVELGGFDAQSLFYLIPKGSITVEGVSLTINSVAETRIKLMLVPHTLSNTTLGSLKTGQQVNIEFDYLTRIVAHQLQVARKLNDLEGL